MKIDPTTIPQDLFVALVGAGILWALGRASQFIRNWAKREKSRARERGAEVALDTQRLVILSQVAVLYALLCLLGTCGLACSAYIFADPTPSLWALLPLIGVGFGMWACDRAMSILQHAGEQLPIQRRTN